MLLMPLQYAIGEEATVDFALGAADIAGVSIDKDSITIKLTISAAESLKEITTANPGKSLSVVYEGIPVTEATIAALMDTGTITVSPPSDKLREAMECWKTGCDDDDAGCD